MITAGTRGINLNFNHVAVSVPDSETAVRWYTETFGFRRLRPNVVMSRKEDSNHIIFHIYGEELSKVKVAYLGTGNGVGFEVFEFVEPKYNGPDSTASFDKKNWTVGGFFHIAITAPEPDELAKKVMATGGRQIGESVSLGNGEKALYVQDPWGNVIEILSCGFEHLVLSAVDR